MTRVAQGPYNRLTVHLDAVEHNYGRLRSLLPPGMGVAAVVKADAYGHGLLPVAKRLKAKGAEVLAVAVAGEGAALRRARIAGPVLCLLGLGPGEAPRAVELSLTPVLARLSDMEDLAAAARAAGTAAVCHLKVDTGMGRLGVEPGEALEVLEKAARLPGLRVEGLDSHLATSGVPGDALAARQAGIFRELLDAARSRGFELPQSSLAASGGALVQPEGAIAPPGLARLGISLYGGLPDPASAGLLDLRGAMSFTSRLISLRRLPAGATVSYGATWTAPRETLVGVVPAGYSDGLPRALSNRGFMLVGGRRRPIRGRVCMNLIMLEIPGQGPEPELGDEVVILGRQGDADITADELAGWADTISYEVTCSLGAANRRRFAPAG